MVGGGDAVVVQTTALHVAVHFPVHFHWVPLCQLQLTGVRLTKLATLCTSLVFVNVLLFPALSLSVCWCRSHLPPVDWIFCVQTKSDHRNYSSFCPQRILPNWQPAHFEFKEAIFRPDDWTCWDPYHQWSVWSIDCSRCVASVCVSGINNLCK